MIPSIAKISIHRRHGRDLLLWIPLALVWLLLAPVVVLILPVVIIACWIAQVSPWQAIAAAWQILCSLKGAEMDVAGRGKSVSIYVF